LELHTALFHHKHVIAKKIEKNKTYLNLTKPNKNKYKNNLQSNCSAVHNTLYTMHLLATLFYIFIFIHP